MVQGDSFPRTSGRNSDWLKFSNGHFFPDIVAATAARARLIFQFASSPKLLIGFYRADGAETRLPSTRPELKFIVSEL